MVNKIVKSWLLIIWMLLTEATHLEVNWCISSMPPAVIDTSNRSGKWTVGWSNVKIRSPEKISDYRGQWQNGEVSLQFWMELRSKILLVTLPMPWEKWDTEARDISWWALVAFAKYLNISYLLFSTSKQHNVEEVSTVGQAAAEDLCLGLSVFLFTPFSLAVSWGWWRSTLCKLLWNQVEKSSIPEFILFIELDTNSMALVLYVKSHFQSFHT